MSYRFSEIDEAASSFLADSDSDSDDEEEQQGTTAVTKDEESEDDDTSDPEPEVTFDDTSAPPAKSSKSLKILNRKQTPGKLLKPKASKRTSDDTASTDDELPQPPLTAQETAAKRTEDLAKKKEKIADAAEAKLAKWSNLTVGPITKKAIDSLGFEQMTEIQYKAIPHVLVR